MRYGATGSLVPVVTSVSAYFIGCYFINYLKTNQIFLFFFLDKY